MSKSSKVVLYVGGLHRNKAKLQKIVESAGHKFKHHDGGVEESIQKLHQLLSDATNVFMPVNCVSHTAQTIVKDHCKDSETFFHPLRTSGISVFSQLLSTIGLGIGAGRFLRPHFNLLYFGRRNFLQLFYLGKISTY